LPAGFDITFPEYNQAGYTITIHFRKGLFKDYQFIPDRNLLFYDSIPFSNCNKYFGTGKFFNTTVTC